MCEQAQEIQDIKRKFNGQVRYGLEMDDYYLIKRLNEVHILEENGIGSLDSIWLPRQDQLQEMANKDAFWCFKSGVLEIYNYETNEESIYFEQFNSFEQLWLAFVMQEKYNKIWYEEKQEWNTKN